MVKHDNQSKIKQAFSLIPQFISIESYLIEKQKETDISKFCGNLVLFLL